MRILILGGTGFTGPFQIRYALDRGHKVTVFNRGKTHPGELPKEVEAPPTLFTRWFLKTPA
jgi:2'-hydroxyisoflavone reductase